MERGGKYKDSRKWEETAIAKTEEVGEDEERRMLSGNERVDKIRNI